MDFADWRHVRRFLHVCENALHALEARGDDYAEREHKKLLVSLRRDGIEYADSRLTPAGRALPELDEVGARFDLPELHRQIQRMRDAVDSDPGLAIGTAKEVVETTCKTILEDRGVEVPRSADIPKLVSLTRKELKLLPDDIPDRAKGVDSIRRLLSNLGQVGQGVTELRALYGTGHGKDGRFVGVPPRIARLAVGTAANLSTFLLDTHEERED